MLQVPFTLRVQKKGARYSMISYNFIFRRLFDLLGLSWLGVDFPPLKNEGKRRKLIAFWVRMTTFLRWPYVNSDAELFGQEFYVDAQTVIKEDLKPEAHPKAECDDRKRKPSGDPSDGDGGTDWASEIIASLSHARDRDTELRRHSEHRPCKKAACMRPDEGMPELLGHGVDRDRRDDLQWAYDLIGGN